MSAKVVVVGAGGNIGSHLVTHLARMLVLGLLRVIDPEVYEVANLRGQDITPADVGRAKAVVQAERIRRIAPGLTVEAIVDTVEDVPLGLLRADVILACLDTRAARRTVGAAAWHLGVPWIDAGVRADQLLARVNLYRPAPGAPCYQCSWDDAAYATVEQAYPCLDGVAPQPTNAPSSLGALAAALQAIECGKVLAGDWETAATGRQVTVSALGHRHYVTRFTANPRCRFDHQTLDVFPVGRHPANVTVAEAFALGGDLGGSLRLRVATQRFARTVRCFGCGTTRALGLRLLGRLRPSERGCPACGSAMRAAGCDVVEWVAAGDLSPALARASLRQLGVHRGDVLTVAGSGGEAHFEIGALEGR